MSADARQVERLRELLAAATPERWTVNSRGVLHRDDGHAGRHEGTLADGGTVLW